MILVPPTLSKTDHGSWEQPKSCKGRLKRKSRLKREPMIMSMRYTAELSYWYYITCNVNGLFLSECRLWRFSEDLDNLYLKRISFLPYAWWKKKRSKLVFFISDCLRPAFWLVTIRIVIQRVIVWRERESRARHVHYSIFIAFDVQISSIFIVQR